EAVDLTRGLLAECRVRLEGIVEKEGFEKNKAIADAKEAVNAYDERTGLPSDHYTDADVEALSEHVFCHIFVQYPDGVDARIH
ncbi:MAG: hypothetical protein L0H63_14670, partial [Nitrococcus sp.]|nr:hypothetical protein [Nitrococcus sp.]